MSELQERKPSAAEWSLLISDLHTRFESKVHEYNASLASDAPRATVERIINGWIRAKIGLGARWQVTLKNSADAGTLTFVDEQIGGVDPFHEEDESYVLLSRKGEPEICLQADGSGQMTRDQFVERVLKSFLDGVLPMRR
jgi:hypothetical protein